MIPTEKLPAVTKAIQYAFGVNSFDSIEQLTKGLSGSLVCKMLIGGKPYLLRLVVKTETRENPAHYFTCMQMAAEAGIAPRIHYMNVEDRISITDFIEARPYPAVKAREQMPVLLRQLHALPKFAASINYVDVADSFVKRFRSSGLVTGNELDDVYEQYDRISAAYPRHHEENQVSCHNDVKKDNIIFDGVRPWLVDWEAAFLNDRFVDLAALANFVVKNEADETKFLQTYFQDSLTGYDAACFYLMGMVVHLFCFTICAGAGTIEPAADLPSFNSFHDRLWAGEVNLGNEQEKSAYGLVHIEEFRRKMKHDRLKEALELVQRM